MLTLMAGRPLCIAIAALVLLGAGPLSADMPAPVARAHTDGQGHYRISGLAPGRYFVTFGLTGHGWVTLAAGQGAQLNGAVCSDCVVAM